MGQSVRAIAYGVKISARLANRVIEHLQDGDWLGFERNEKPNATDFMRDRYDVLGYVVAIESHSGCHPGAIGFFNIPSVEVGDPTELDRLEGLIGDEVMTEARRKWAALRRVAGRRMRLATPTLIITTVSTA